MPLDAVAQTASEFLSRMTACGPERSAAYMPAPEPDCLSLLPAANASPARSIASDAAQSQLPGFICARA